MHSLTARRFVAAGVFVSAQKKWAVYETRPKYREETPKMGVATSAPTLLALHKIVLCNAQFKGFLC